MTQQPSQSVHSSVEADAFLHAWSYATPFGDLTVVATPEDGVVRSSGFRPMSQTVAHLPAEYSGRRLDHRTLDDAAHGDPSSPVAQAIEAWLAGDGSLLATVPVSQSGGPFFQEVWGAMRDVPSGEVVSYQELAHMAGRPRAVRAAGTACARNNLAPFVPCHRVVKSGGELGNYGFGGPALKAAMLELEGANVAELAGAGRDRRALLAQPVGAR